MPSGVVAVMMSGAAGLILPFAMMQGRSSRFAQRRPPARPEPFPDGFAKGAYRAGPGIREPRLRRDAAPRFPPEARRWPTAVDVELLAIVQPDGSITARVLAAPEPRGAFEREALAAAAGHVFEPGLMDGTPVAVVATLVLTFQPPAGRGSGARVIGGTADPPSRLDSPLASGAETPGPGLLRPLPVRKVYPPPPAGLVRPGRVEMLTIIGTDGTVEDLEVTKSLDVDEDFEDAAAAAVRQWEFEPALRDGRAVPVLVTSFITVAKPA